MVTANSTVVSYLPQMDALPNMQVQLFICTLLQDVNHAYK